MLLGLRRRGLCTRFGLVAEEVGLITDPDWLKDGHLAIAHDPSTSGGQSARREVMRVNNHSPLYAEVEIYVSTEWRRIVQARITPWAFTGTGTEVSVEDFDGRRHYVGSIRFSGSIREVFWCGFIDPYLKDLVCRSFGFAAELARDRQADSGPLLAETAALLKGITGSAYARMKKIDGRHHRSGSRALSEIVDTHARVAQLRAFVDDIAAGYSVEEKPEIGHPLLEESDPEYRPAGWFAVKTKLPAARLRQAATPHRRSKNVRKVGSGRTVRYSALDARTHWPECFK
ncbi:MAG: hypothetical protein ACI9EF_002668 [Pseudohongiellaceae bacterium]|jgi:hypothetical protein